MKHYFILFIKGMSMGIANVIPGVSGGTIALITEIYEELINSLKSFDLKSVKLLLSGQFKGFITHTNLYFLISVFAGSLFSMLSVAKLFEYLFDSKTTEVLLWSFFFGLILASVYYVGLRVGKWKVRSYIFFIIGTSIAVSLSLLSPSSESTNLFYIFTCGVIGVSGMLLPGLSGSFILILMGNYKLLMVESLSKILKFNIDAITYLLVFTLGSVVGLFGFSHIISWLFKRFKDCILSLLTGFILGSLLIIWPWKEIAENKLITSWHLPELNNNTIAAISLMLIGFYVVVKLETFTKAD
jgi:putative membrane protein